MLFNKVHHIAIICSDYNKSKFFYNQVLQLPIIQETYRQNRKSYKLDLKINDDLQLELFSSHECPSRPSYPEACGLRHLAFNVTDINNTIEYLKQHNVICEPIKVDSITNKKFTFFQDPDNLPLELYEI